MTLILRIIAWLLTAAVTFATLGPPSYRPHSALGQDGAKQQGSRSALDNIAPDASEALRLAVRCQHIQRWTIPRHTYAMDRHGYLRWRTTLAKFHADTAAAIFSSTLKARI